jgi:hypothetical protein
MDVFLEEMRKGGPDLSMQMLQDVLCEQPLARTSNMYVFSEWPQTENFLSDVESFKSRLSTVFPR